MALVVKGDPLKFQMELCPTDPSGLEQDCLYLLRHHGLIKDWFHLTQILWKENPAFMSVLGQYFLRALWPKYDAKLLQVGAAPRGGHSNGAHLKSFAGDMNTGPEYWTDLSRLAGWYYASCCVSGNISQALKWSYFAFGSQGETALGLLWGDWSEGVPTQIGPVALAAIKLYREGPTNFNTLKEDTWEERTEKGYGSQTDNIKTWGASLDQALEEGVFVKDPKDYVIPVDSNFEIPWWQSLEEMVYIAPTTHRMVGSSVRNLESTFRGDSLRAIMIEEYARQQSDLQTFPLRNLFPRK